MIINSLKLKKYRNYGNLDIEFNECQNIIIGDNAQGKTNIIEAIYYLGITKSFLGTNDKTIINNNSDSCSILGEITADNNKKKLNIILNKEDKKLRINSKDIRRHAEYIGNMKVIIFSPDNVRLLKEGPVNRRKFLNIEISQLYNKYVNILNDYNVLLKQRNEYLKNVKFSGNSNLIYMDIINNKYIDLNINIVKYRVDFINCINKYIGDIYYNIAGDKGLYIKYIPCIQISAEEDMRKNLKNKIDSVYDRELTYGSSLIGSQRDDFGFYLGESDLSLYGSQGQVRMAILSLKLAEAFVFNEICGEKPILLLDDIFSELDVNKRNNLIKYLDMDIQSIITTTDLNDISHEFIEKAKIYKIVNGSVTLFNNTGSEENYGR